jgi:hypothetical protein
LVPRLHSFDLFSRSPPNADRRNYGTCSGLYAPFFTSSQNTVEPHTIVRHGGGRVTDLQHLFARHHSGDYMASAMGLMSFSWSMFRYGFVKGTGELEKKVARLHSGVPP